MKSNESIFVTGAMDDAALRILTDRFVRAWETADAASPIDGSVRR